MHLTLQIMHVRVSESNQSTTTGLFASPDLKNDLDKCTPRHTEVAKGWQSTLLGLALAQLQILVIFIPTSTMPQTGLFFFKFLEIIFMPPKILFSFPESRVRKHQLLTATSFPEELPSSELQLPSPRLATSPLNIEHNERAFFKQPFYTAPLKGTI